MQIWFNQAFQICLYVLLVALSIYLIYRVVLGARNRVVESLKFHEVICRLSDLNKVLKGAANIPGSHIEIQLKPTPEINIPRKDIVGLQIAKVIIDVISICLYKLPPGRAISNIGYDVSGTNGNIRIAIHSVCYFAPMSDNDLQADLQTTADQPEADITSDNPLAGSPVPNAVG